MGELIADHGPYYGSEHPYWQQPDGLGHEPQELVTGGTGQSGEGLAGYLFLTHGIPVPKEYARIPSEAKGDSEDTLVMPAVTEEQVGWTPAEQPRPPLGSGWEEPVTTADIVDAEGLE